MGRDQSSAAATGVPARRHVASSSGEEQLTCHDGTRAAAGRQASTVGRDGPCCAAGVCRLGACAPSALAGGGASEVEEVVGLVMSASHK